MPPLSDAQLEAKRQHRLNPEVRAREAAKAAQWKKANAEKVRKYARDRYWRNAEELREQMRLRAAERRRENPEAARAYAVKRYRENRDGINAARRARWANDAEYRERRATLNKAWIAANPERVVLAKAEGRAVRRARLRGATIEPVDYAAIIARDKSRCHLCGKRVPAKEIHLDHILPLSAGGEHSAANLAVAHAHCNLSKGARARNDQLRLVG